MAATSEAMKSSVVTIRKLTADERVRMQCEARELQLMDQRTWESLRKKEEAGRKQAEEGRKQAEARAEKEKEGRLKAEAGKQKAEARIRELELLLAQQTGGRKEE